MNRNVRVYAYPLDLTSQKNTREFAQQGSYLVIVYILSAAIHIKIHFLWRINNDDRENVAE